MDIEDIKQFIPRKGERIILMEKGKPIFVLISFDDYKELNKAVGQENQAKLLSGHSNFQESGSRFEGEDEENGQKEEIEFQMPESTESFDFEETKAEDELTLDDLPF